MLLETQIKLYLCATSGIIAAIQARRTFFSLQYIVEHKSANQIGLLSVLTGDYVWKVFIFKKLKSLNP